MKKRTNGTLLLIAILLGCLFPTTGIPQAKTAPASKTPLASTDLLRSLPSSDGVLTVDVKRLLNEMLPKVLADDPAKLAQVNARIDRIKARTGIDVRSFERIAVGMRFVNDTQPNSIKAETVALARGQVNVQEMLASGLLAQGSKYKYQEQKYGGKTIYIFKSDELFGQDELPQVTISEETKKAGGKAAEVAGSLLQRALNFKGDVAIVAIDSNTLAIGQLERVRAAIDAKTKLDRVDVAITELATRSPEAVIGYCLNVPANASRYFGVDNDQISKNIDFIRQAYGFVGSTNVGFEMQNFLRTTTTAQAQSVFNQLMGLKELGGFFSASMSGEKGKLAQNAIENLTITKNGEEVMLKLELAQADVAMLVRVLDKKN